MCGILAQYKINNFNTSDLYKLKGALSAIDHRGPDGQGATFINLKNKTTSNVIVLDNVDDSVLSSSEVLLAHKRLSIIDTSSAGHQPMHSHNGIITFNGEIYNYIEIRNELREFGYVFNTDCDTEIILAAYDKWNEKCLDKFNGMFSFVLYDQLTNSLFIANDRFGVKPLYYYQDRDTLIFASEIKQFYAFNLNLIINDDVVNTFLETAYLDYDEQTFFKEIKRFPKAHFCYVNFNKELSKLKFNCYYSLNLVKKTYSNTVEEFNTLFTDSVNLRMRSDVPIGFASSGGLDSSAILYRAYSSMKKEGKPINFKTFSAIFPGLEGDESKFIKYIENDIDVNAFYVNPLESFSIPDFETHIKQQDMPVASTSYYAEWCVARLVRTNDVKVLLIGQGGDELLAGYHHHFYRYCRQLILQGKFKTYLSQLKLFCELKSMEVNKMHKQIINEVKYAIKIKLGLKSTHHSLEKHWNSANKLIDLLKIDFTETMLPTYLRSDDRDSMAFGVETRHPFLDYRLVDYCFSLPDDDKIKNGWQKHLLRESLTELPEIIRYRKDKKGYTTPEKLWIKNNKTNFEQYLDYIPEQFKAKSANPFLNYALGAWCKLNNIK